MTSRLISDFAKGHFVSFVMQWLKQNIRLMHDHSTGMIHSSVRIIFYYFREKYSTASAAAMMSIDRLRVLERIEELMKVYKESVNTNIGVSRNLCLDKYCASIWYFGSKSYHIYVKEPCLTLYSIGYF